MDTIFAQATAPGRAGVSVVRVSGPQARAVLEEMAGPPPPARQAVVRNVTGLEGGLIDQALVLFFEGPESFTGEDVIEFHLHGSIAVVQAVLDCLAEIEETRIADPGEFTRRALENDKLDLTQAEGLADLIEAETEAQRKQALNVLSGQLGEKVEGWRSALIRAASLIEATIDFADEEVPVDVTDEVSALITSVEKDLRAEIAGTKVAERVKAGFEVAILGAPNAGKSTLLNALAGRDAAITSSVAGTTRDVIEVRMNIAGLPVTLLDTAGLRETEDLVEAEGVARAVSRADTADLRVFLKNPGETLAIDPKSDDIVLRPKGDLLNGAADSISGKTGFGVEQLVSRIEEVLQMRVAKIGLATHVRHRTAMTEALEYIYAVDTALTQGPDLYDIAAAELRFSIRALEVLVGRIDVENLLDEIFSSFCVGK